LETEECKITDKKH